jgi:hypothetical protein
MGERLPERALALARQHQLVTAVSAAVVLERKAELVRAGLEPGEPAGVPSIPEPGTWALLLVGLVLLLWKRSS